MEHRRAISRGGLRDWTYTRCIYDHEVEVCGLDFIPCVNIFDTVTYYYIDKTNYFLDNDCSDGKLEMCRQHAKLRY